jgi:hypothetical protein
LRQARREAQLPRPDADRPARRAVGEPRNHKPPLAENPPSWSQRHAHDRHPLLPRRGYWTNKRCQATWW